MFIRHSSVVSTVPSPSASIEPPSRTNPGVPNYCVPKKQSCKGLEVEKKLCATRVISFTFFSSLLFPTFHHITKCICSVKKESFNKKICSIRSHTLSVSSLLHSPLRCGYCFQLFVPLPTCINFRVFLL